DRWTVRHRHLLTSIEATDARLTNELVRRGVAVTGRGVDAFAAYVDGCADRARLAAEASRRPDLERELVARTAAERAVSDARDRCARAAESLRAVAKRCAISIPSTGESTADGDRLVAAL